MNNLDNTASYENIDPAGMRHRLMELPRQCEQAFAAGLAVRGVARGPVSHIVVAGMGGSAIGADLLCGLLAPELDVPVTVVRGYSLPAYAIGNSTLVIASSSSGNTEETLTAFAQAQAQGCQLAAVTTGGALAAHCEAAGVPMLRYAWNAAPREAVGWATFGLLGMLVAAGLVRNHAADVAETVTLLAAGSKAIGHESPATRNSAKRVAGQFADRLPVIYGAGLLRAVARRWKTQLNENAKMLAVADEMPELNHNSVVGYEHATDVWRRTIVIALRCAQDHPRVNLRYDATRTLLLQAGVNQDTIVAKGSGPLAQMMSLVQYGDWVSYYTAIMKGIDPSPVAAIDLLKQELAQ